MDIYNIDVCFPKTAVDAAFLNGSNLCKNKKINLNNYRDTLFIKKMEQLLISKK